MNNQRQPHRRVDPYLCPVSYMITTVGLLICRESPSMGDKYCIKCKQNKPESEFYRLTRSRDGLQTYCKDCHKASSIGYFDARKMARRAARAERKKAGAH
jgi:hypothetical protein